MGTGIWGDRHFECPDLCSACVSQMVALRGRAMTFEAERAFKDNGYWTREEVVRMDTMAQAQMLRCHPKRANAEVLRSLKAFFNKEIDGEAPIFVPPNPAEILSGIFSLAPSFIGSEAEFIGAPPIIRTDKETARRIKKQVVARHGLTVNDIESRGRGRKLAWARFEAIYLIATETKLSWPQIGALFGRDHTTAMHGAWRHACKNDLPPPRGMNLSWKGQVRAA